MRHLRNVIKDDLKTSHFKKWFSEIKKSENYIPVDFVRKFETGSCYGVFDTNTELDGFIFVEPKGEAYKLSGFYLNPELHDKGLGQLLLETVLMVLKDKTNRLYLKVGTDNKRAIHIYDKFNFKVVDTKPSTKLSKLYHTMERDI